MGSFKCPLFGYKVWEQGVEGSSPSQLAADNARIDANKCSSFGFKVGTNQYANCMMQQDNNRQKLNTQNRKELNKMSKCLMKNSGWSTTPKTFGQILGEC